ncbi:MAG: cation transporter [Acidobacteria bacterium]|nr:cation transporter [Acidobacteriota bacterium]
MNTRIKTSLIAISITLGLTVLKFVFYFLSGSIAVLSEAWHSFSDITTSLLVLLALWRSASLLKQKQVPPETGVKETKFEEDGVFRRFFKSIFGEYIEVTVSFIIGIFLTVISISLIVNAYATKVVIIQKPLITGVIFLLLSAGSYFLYKFLSDVGRAENSAALVSDGLHSKGDMVCSSLTGISLILYYFNFNIDRWVSFAIALLILSFGIEIIFNVIAYFHKKHDAFQLHYHFLEILGIALNKDIYISFFKWVDGKFNIDILKSKLVVYFVRLLKFAGYALVSIIIIIIVYDTGFQVQMDEEAVIERFGKPVNRKALQPGFHFKFPRPIDKVRIEKTKQVRELFLGNIAKEEQKPLIWGVAHGEEIHFLSGDNYFFNPYIILHYRIKDLYKYYYNIHNPRDLLESVSYKILQNIFTTKPFYQIAITYRKELEAVVENALQNELDAINTGLEVVGVNIKDIHPPISISDAFEEVVASYQKKMEIINLAHEYQNQSIPDSRGEAYSNISDANAYVQEEILKSEGEVVGFKSKLNSYENNKSIIRKILYYNYIVSVLKEKNKILIDPGVGEPDLYLNFENDLYIPE